MSDNELLTRAEVDALIETHELGEHRKAILAAIRPGCQLFPAAGGPHRIGGAPDLAAGETWPVDAEGVPYTFVAQFDASRLPTLGGDFRGPAWPHGGQLLRLFSALDSDEGAPCPAVALARAPDAPLTRSAAGPSLSELPVEAYPPILSAHHAVPDRTYRDWATLFSLPSHDGLSFGDGGSLAVVILLEDLAAARYDRLWTDTSTG